MHHLRDSICIWEIYRSSYVPPPNKCQSNEIFSRKWWAIAALLALKQADKLIRSVWHHALIQLNRLDDVFFFSFLLSFAAVASDRGPIDASVSIGIGYRVRRRRIHFTSTAIESHTGVVSDKKKKLKIKPNYANQFWKNFESKMGDTHLVKASN